MALPSLEEIEAAHERIKPFIHRTPVYTSQSIDRIAGCSIHFKCENFQKIGAFKIRGATNALLSLTENELSNGVATHSSGNHAQAVALAARDNGRKAYVVMPENSSKVKVEAVKSYGAQITFCGTAVESRQETLNKVLQETGASFIHPYNNLQVITGQATAAKELLEDVQDLDIVIAPVGGGGLMSGTCLASHYLSPHTEIIGSEPENVNDAFRSLAAGTIQTNQTTDTIADGLKTNLGDLTFEIIKEHISQIITVSESEIIEAMRLIWERMKIIIEPSSAVPLAAILREPQKFKGKRVGLIVTGGNVELGSLPFKT
ncbi:MAG: pyridoxal-phosphate dependent enzyme [Flavobacteriales bacterium]|nr:pyridoxal-phosphate dependent enzyme [Flavobacteriales bacterium]